MTPLSRLRRTSARLVAPALLLVALSACSAGVSDAAVTRTPTPSDSGPCAEVTIVVDFGTLKSPALKKCATAGTAAEALKAAGIATEGTADYGDQVVCRVDELPSPASESCAKLPSAAYWAVWVKPAGGVWAYAQEGVTTQQVTAGQSLGLVYTVGSDSTPPQD